VAITMRLVQRPTTVDHVTVSNPTSLALDIDAGGAPSGDWTPAGDVDPKSTETFAEVIDQGDTWWFRATSGGNVATWDVSRAQLEREGWRVSVPDAVGAQLSSSNAG
jgi:hypothetical protein